MIQELPASRYIQRLDLGGDPFAEANAGRFFYKGAGRGQLLDQLVHHVRFGQQVLSLGGDHGSGKSVVVRQLIEQLQGTMDSCCMNARHLNTPQH